MENNSPVPVKIKIAALMLIGAGIAFAVIFLFSFFDIGLFRIGPVAEFKADQKA